MSKKSRIDPLTVVGKRLLISRLGIIWDTRIIEVSPNAQYVMIEDLGWKDKDDFTVVDVFPESVKQGGPA